MVFIDDEWVYAWEEDFVDEDEKLWIVTMFFTLMMPLYESIKLHPLLFPKLLEQIIHQ